MKDWKNNLLDQVIRENLFEQTLSPIWTGFTGERKIQSLKQQFNETGKVIDGFSITSNTEISDETAKMKIKYFSEYNKDHVYFISDNIKVGNQYRRDVIYQWKTESSNQTKISKLNSEYTTIVNSILNFVTSYDYSSILINGDRIMNRVPNVSDRKKLLPIAFKYSINKADIFHYENDQLVSNGVLQSPVGEYIKFKYPEFFKLIEKNWADIVISGVQSMYTKQSLSDSINSLNVDYKVAKDYQKQTVNIFNDVKSYFASKTELTVTEFVNSEWTTIKSKLNDSDSSIYTWYRLSGDKSLMYYFDSNWYFAKTEAYIRYMHGRKLTNSDTGVVTDQQVIEKLNVLKPDINKKIRESIQSNPIKFNETGERIEYVQSILYKILKKLQATNAAVRNSKP